MVNWFKKWGWTLFLGLILIGGGIAFFLLRKNGDPAKSNLAKKTREKIVNAETDALIEKNKVIARAKNKLDKLDKIEEMEDGVSKRKALADFINDVL